MSCPGGGSWGICRCLLISCLMTCGNVGPVVVGAAPRRYRYPGRLPVDDRPALGVIVYVWCTSVSWRDVPVERVGCSGVAAGSRASLRGHEICLAPAVVITERLRPVRKEPADELPGAPRLSTPAASDRTISNTRVMPGRYRLHPLSLGHLHRAVDTPALAFSEPGDISTWPDQHRLWAGCGPDGLPGGSMHLVPWATLKAAWLLPLPGAEASGDRIARSPSLLFPSHDAVNIGEIGGGVVGLGLRVHSRLLISVTASVVLLAALLVSVFKILGDRAQAFSAASVLLSGIALAGVAMSLMYQARQTKAVRDERDRATHRQMVYLAMGDRTLAACWEPPDTPIEFERYRQVIFTNLIIGRWHAAYQLGDIDASTLRFILDRHFRGEIGRLHWSLGRSTWLRGAVGGRDRRAAMFAEIVEDRYKAAISSGPAVPADGYFIQPGADC